MKFLRKLIIPLILITLVAIFCVNNYGIFLPYLEQLTYGKKSTLDLFPGVVSVYFNNKTDNLSFNQMKSSLEQEKGAIVDGSRFELMGSNQLPQLSYEATQKIISELKSDNRVLSVNIDDYSIPKGAGPYTYLRVSFNKNISKNDAITLIQKYGITDNRMGYPSYINVSVPKGREIEYAIRFKKYNFVSRASQGYDFMTSDNGNGLF